MLHSVQACGPVQRVAYISIYVVIERVWTNSGAQVKGPGKRHQRLCTLCLADQVDDELIWYLSVMHMSQYESSFGICLMTLEIG
jgi:hypothetical protein